VKAAAAVTLPPVARCSACVLICVVQAVDIVQGLHRFLGSEAVYIPLSVATLPMCIQRVGRLVRSRSQKEMARCHPNVRIVVCGGDGSVSWVLSELVREGLNDRVALSVIPVGTGNDMSIATGWGGVACDTLIGRCTARR
jgi:hypothetical protein